MKRNTLAKKLTAGLLTGVMVLSMGGMSALADQTVKGGNVDDALKKYLVMDEDANVPNATFTYSIVQGDPISATGSAPEIKAGVGTPTVQFSQFSPLTPTYTEVQVGDSIELEENQKYAIVKSDIDFSSVEFTEPGIYRYEITEDDSSVPGITEATNIIYLDVYVVSDNEGNLSVDNYILHKTDAVGIANDKNEYGFASDEKTTGFINKYATADFTLKKKVEGNQGNRNKYFEFQVNISGAAEGTVYSVDNSNASSSDNDYDDLVVNSDGTVSKTYYLKDGESISIQGLTADTLCQVTENLNASEGYTTENDHDDSDGNGLTSDTVQVGENGLTITFTNSREVITPTGIAMTFAPYAVMVAFAGVFAVVFLRKKREDC